MNEEIWKDVVGRSGYQVSNLGNVRSFKNGEYRLLKGSITWRGYKIVFFWVDGKSTNNKVHRLVYEAHIGKIPQGLQVDHINHIRTDNRLENLRVVTSRVNNQNRDKSKTSSRYSGVSWHKGKKVWQSQINIGGKIKHLGSYKLEEDAAMAYQNALSHLKSLV